MRSTEPISAPDYPFRRTFWPQFSEKRHPDFGNRAFQPPIASLAIIPCPEKATFSNNAGPIPGNKVLGDNRGGGLNEMPWQWFRRFPVGNGAPGGQKKSWPDRLPEIFGEKCTAGKFVKVLRR